MRSLFKSDFFWRFIGGFALGAVGVVMLHPGVVIHSPAQPAAIAQSVAR